MWCVKYFDMRLNIHSAKKVNKNVKKKKKLGISCVPNNEQSRDDTL